jgi:hypothetical protein
VSLVVDAWRDGDGVATVELSAIDGGATLVERDGGGAVVLEAALPRAVVEAAARRYGRALDGAVTASVPSGRVAIGGASLELLQHRSPVDVEPNDWLVLRDGRAEPIAAPARLLSAALRALARSRSTRGA